MRFFVDFRLCAGVLYITLNQGVCCTPLKNGVVELSRRSSDNLRVVLISAAVLLAGSGAALADVQIGVDAEPRPSAFGMLPLDRQSSPPACDIADRAEVDRGAELHTCFTDIMSAAGLGQLINSGRSQCPDTQDMSAKIRQLPAGPGGATLFLMGVGCLGAVRLGKSARSLHLQSLPEWFHTDGPMQIGHAAVWDFGCYETVFCMLSKPGDMRQFRRYHRREVPSRCREDQFLVAVEAPRGPPALS